MRVRLVWGRSSPAPSTRRFPYSLYYRASGDVLVVMAVFHHRRPPSARLGRR
ncbi:MAG: hypothetical protein ACK44A_16530 [Roseateles sp.]